VLKHYGPEDAALRECSFRGPPHRPALRRAAGGHCTARLRGRRAHLGSRALAGPRRPGRVSRGRAASSPSPVISSWKSSARHRWCTARPGMADQPLRAGPATRTRLPLRLRYARYRTVRAAARPRRRRGFRSCRPPLPTLDELIGRAELRGVDPVDHVLAVTAAVPAPRDHVFTLHAELEGGRVSTLVRAAAARLAAAAWYAPDGPGDLRRGNWISPASRAAASWPARSRGRSGTLALQSQWKEVKEASVLRRRPGTHRGAARGPATHYTPHPRPAARIAVDFTQRNLERSAAAAPRLDQQLPARVWPRIAMGPRGSAGCDVCISMTASPPGRAGARGVASAGTRTAREHPNPTVTLMSEYAKPARRPRPLWLWGRRHRLAAGCGSQARRARISLADLSAQRSGYDLAELTWKQRSALRARSCGPADHRAGDCPA